MAPTNIQGMIQCQILILCDQLFHTFVWFLLYKPKSYLSLAEMESTNVTLCDTSAHLQFITGQRLIRIKSRFHLRPNQHTDITI